MQYIDRVSEKLVNERLKNKEILFILGSRQVGKTTLIKHVLESKNSVYFNLDIPVDMQRLIVEAKSEPLQALRHFGSPQYIIIDEAQRLPEVGRLVKGWFDAHVPVKIVLLGSSTLDLLDKTAESLAGRNEKVFLPPLSFGEILTTQSWYVSKESETQFPDQIRAMLMQCLVYGSYPGRLQKKDYAEYLNNLAFDYLLKDLDENGLVKDPQILRRLLAMLALQVGSESSVSELATSLGISRITVQRYLDLLERIYVIFRLPAFSRNPRKEISKNQKIYFWDTGIRNAIISQFSESELRTDIGALWENWIIAEFAKQNWLHGDRFKMYFWRNVNGGEVDLVLTKDEAVYAYEIKWQEKKIHTRAFFDAYGVTPILIHSKNPLVSLP